MNRQTHLSAFDLNLNILNSLPYFEYKWGYINWNSGKVGV